MSCEHSKDCVYYRTHRYKSSVRQFRLLVDNYCEGTLQTRCQRLRYRDEFCEEAPDELAPNGYHVGTKKKLKTDNARKFERYKIIDGACMLQILDTPKMFSAGIIDISEGGMRLELNVHPKELKNCLEKSLLKVLNYSLENLPFPFTKEIIKIVWQNNRVIGCSFAGPLFHR